MKLKELIVWLANFDPEAEVIFTWEGIGRSANAIYNTPAGAVVVDVDDGMYREAIESGAHAL